VKKVSYHSLLFGICFFGGAPGGLASTLASSDLPSMVKDLAAAEAHNSGAVANAAFMHGNALFCFSIVFLMGFTALEYAKE
jgi:hypothetical protein